jgi:hypothetical protein
MSLSECPDGGVVISRQPPADVSIENVPASSSKPTAKPGVYRPAFATARSETFQLPVRQRGVQSCVGDERKFSLSLQVRHRACRSEIFPAGYLPDNGENLPSCRVGAWKVAKAGARPDKLKTTRTATATQTN